jgi:TrmH family RNA methyltransferase
MRNAERAFLVEGVRAVLDGIAAGGVPELAVVSDQFDAAHAPDELNRFPLRTIDHRLFETLADTVTPQGILAVFPLPTPAAPSTEPEFSLVADGIADPGNLGTLLRTAAAAGASRVLLTPGTADPYNPKVVRSAMGAHFRVPIERIESPSDIPVGISILLLAAGEESLYAVGDLTGPIWIVVGSEAHGSRFDFGDRPVTRVSLPMPGGSESLNAAVAGSIALYEVLRQRSHRSR